MTRQQRRAAERVAIKRQEQKHYVVAIVPMRPDVPGMLRLAERFFREHAKRDGPDGTRYYLCVTSSDAGSKAFTHPVTGETYSAYRSFRTLDAADAWVTQDMHQRAAMLSAQGQLQ
jgi:hypothetical protein